MLPEDLFALTGLAAAAAWTPGPNNALLAASGANFGLRRSLPHIAGVVFGFAFMLFVVGLGLGEVMLASPVIREGLRWGGAALLLWFGWRIATAGRAGPASASARPLSFIEAAGFQWINPKGWAMCLAIVSQFGGTASAMTVAALAALVFIAVGAGSSFGWAGSGAALQRFLATPLRLRVFNVAMGGFVAAFALVLVAE